MNRLTVEELRRALEGVPGELEVHLSSDTAEAYEIVLELARRVTYDQPGYTGAARVDYFDIYGNIPGGDC